MHFANIIHLFIDQGFFLHFANIIHLFIAHPSFHILGIDLLGFHVFLSILADAHLCSYFYAAILFYLLDVYVLKPFLWCIILTFLYSCAANVFLIKPDHLSYSRCRVA